MATEITPTQRQERLEEERDDRQREVGQLVARSIMGASRSHVPRSSRPDQSSTTVIAADSQPVEPIEVGPTQEPDWRIDEATRLAGVRGLQKARTALDEARGRSTVQNPFPRYKK